MLLGEWEMPPGVVVLGRIPEITLPRHAQTPSRPAMGRKSIWKRPFAVTTAVAALGVLSWLVYAVRQHWTAF